MSKVRLTAHNGRKGKNGVFSPKHNDRQFDLEGVEHIDPAKTKDNICWLFCREDTGECNSIEEHELNYYKVHFEADRNKRNENPIKNRQYSRVKTMEQYISSPNTCPEETIFQIGKASDVQKAGAEILAKIFEEFVLWHTSQYPQVVILDAVIHVDEPGAADHLQMRKVWVAHENGIEIVNQTKALEEMDVERIFPDKPKGRYNNAKITYTMACREKLIELGKKYGFDIEEIPKETSKVGLEKLKYERQQEEHRLNEARQEADAIIETINDVKENVLKTIVPEKVGLFQHKTGNMVMNEETYAQVMESVNYLTIGANKLIENAKATDENVNKTAEARQKAEQSAYRQELAIREAVQKRLEEGHRKELEAKEEADRERDMAVKLKKKMYAIVKKAVANTNSDMKAYYSKHQLADGRNALEAFEQDNAMRIRRRLDDAEALVGADIKDMAKDGKEGMVKS
ncbi:MAG: hypothetical protein ACI4YB_00485 [Oscillospiraceae bacterium]